jgi:hypothetical protein
VTADDLETKLARLGARVAAQGETVRGELERIGALELAQALRETFGAKLAFLRTDRLTQGTDAESHPFNFDLRASHATAGPVRPDAAPPRPSDEPYRGRKGDGKRPGRRAPPPDRGRDPPQTWHDVQADR